MELSEMFDLDDGPSKEEGGTGEDVEESPEEEDVEMAPEVLDELEIEGEPEGPRGDRIADLEDRYIRLQAEFDNYRKYMEKAMSDGHKRAGERMVCEVLDVLDNLERALTAKCDDQGLREGVQMVYAQMYDVLGRWGVTEVEAEGCRFDPYLHEAVERVEDSGESNGTVIRVLKKGFTLNSNVIRHARVAVAAGQCSDSPDDDANGGEVVEKGPATEEGGGPPGEGEDEAPKGEDDNQADDDDEEEK